MSVIEELSCAHCGGPVQFSPGEIITTCRYCGFTQVIETGRPFKFEHSMLLNAYGEKQVDEVVREWMASGFTKPSNLARASRITEKNLVYIPFWVVDIKASSKYKGIFERLTPPVVKEGKIEKRYDWLVIARKATQFPTREFDVPLKGKITYDFRKIEDFAKILNSEIDKREALEKAREQVEAHHQFLAKQDVDRIIEIATDFNYGDAVYLHAPIWFITYEYRKESHRIVLDGATGTVIKGDIPTSLGLF